MVIGKKYWLRRRNAADTEWFSFVPETWVASDRLWWGESSTDEKVLFEWELPHFDVIELPDAVKPTCDCGGHKARTTHSHWCSSLTG